MESIRLLKGKLLKAQQEQIEQATLELGKYARALRDFLASASELDFVKATKLLPQLSAGANQNGRLTNIKDRDLFSSFSHETFLP